LYSIIIIILSIVMADDDDCTKPICKDSPFGNLRRNLGQTL